MAEKRKNAEKFEGYLQRLEEAVGELEAGTLSLDESLERYEAGAEALKRCREILAQAEKRIEKLVADANGSLRAEPLDAPEGDDTVGDSQGC